MNKNSLKSLVLASFLFIPLLSYCQLPWENCVYTQNRIDEFKGYRVQETESINIVLSFGEGLELSFKQIDSLYYMNYLRSVGETLSVDEGAEFLIKLTNDSIVTLYNLEFKISESNTVKVGNSYYTSSYIELTYPISEIQLRNILANTILKYRFYTNSGYIEDEIKEKKNIDIDRIINCILY